MLYIRWLLQATYTCNKYQLRIYIQVTKPTWGLPRWHSNPPGKVLSQVVKNLPSNAGDLRDANSIPGSGRSSEEDMSTHSHILAWKIPWPEEPGELQSMGSQRVRHN